MYEKAIVTFLDILGFADIIQRSPQATVSGILDSLQRFTVPEAEDDPGYEPEVITFSDSIVRVRRLATETNIRERFGLLFSETFDLVHAQANLIDSGVLLRGGVAFGDISLSGRRVFGPALIDAYELESKYAQYPRIVFSPYLFRELKANPLLVAWHHDSETEISFIRDMLRQGDDGMWFVDYARAIERELDEPETYPNFLRIHRALIVKRARQFKKLDRILAKYLWLANYHNCLIREIKAKRFRQYGVRKSRLLIKLKELPML